MTPLLAMILLGVAAGLMLVFVPPRFSTHQAQAAFGASLATGAAIALAFFFLQREDEDNQKKVSQKETLRLGVALAPDLTGADLSGEEMSEFDLSQKDLSDADLDGAVLRKATLRGTRLDRASLNEAKLGDANLTRASLQKAFMNGVDLRRAVLRKARLEGAFLGPGRGGRRADLRKARMLDARLTGACLAKADLRGALLGDVDLRGAVLTGADLRGAVLDFDGVYANLRGAIGLRTIKLDAAQRTLLPRIAGTPAVAGRPDRVPVPAAARNARVTRVSDGDTFQLDDGRWVRLIGLDAPDPDQPIGPQATKAMERMVLRNADIRYVLGDPETENRPVNPPGRTRAYVWLADGTFLNEELVVRGYARRQRTGEDTRRETSAYARTLDAAQQYARDRGDGVWATCQRHAPD
jgi:uncharacterized protein YjbI with pentapeptide repeats